MTFHYNVVETVKKKKNVFFLEGISALYTADHDSSLSKVPFVHLLPHTLPFQVQLVLFGVLLLTAIAWVPRPNFIFIPKILHLLLTSALLVASSFGGAGFLTFSSSCRILSPLTLP